MLLGVLLNKLYTIFSESPMMNLFVKITDLPATVTRGAGGMLNTPK